MAMAEQMSRPDLHIARDGLLLGTLPSGDARELLAAGFLKPTDEFWTDANPTRRPVGELAAVPRGETPSWLVRATSSVANVGAAVKEKASSATSRVSALARRNKDAVAAASERMLEDYLPRLREYAMNNLEQSLRSAKAALQDEAFLRQMFGAVYDCLPRPVRRFVREGIFVEFCLKHRRRLLD